MAELTWESGFEAGWEACEKRERATNDHRLAERNAARAESRQFKAERDFAHAQIKRLEAAVQQWVAAYEEHRAEALDAAYRDTQ